MSAKSNSHGTALATGDIPVLHLDGTILRTAVESMIECSNQLGGIEVIVDGLRGKSLLFQRTFSDDGQSMTDREFFDACAFMPTVRRRLKPVLQGMGFASLRDEITRLLDAVTLENMDSRMADLTDRLASGKSSRWVRDLAAEILHFRQPELFPLMTRWIWDHESNTGVLREIWFSDSPDQYIDIPNGVRTHLELRREIHEFFEESGIFADREFIMDILFAWVYSQYIGSQGGSFLNSEFNNAGTPMGFAIRMLGLDTAIGDSGLTHMILGDGERHRLSETYDAPTH